MSSAEADPTPPADRGRLLPWLVAVAFFMQSLDTTILNTAVPSIGSALQLVTTRRSSVCSMQFTSMNTLVYADVTAADTGSASTIASTAQQLSMSFGVAAASLVAAVFVPDRFHTAAPQMMHGIHEAFVVLGVATVISSVVFHGLRRTDGSAVSQHRTDLPPA